MLLCQCHRVTDRAVEGLIDAGADRVGQVVRATRAGTDCGGCIPALRQVCQQLLSERDVRRGEFADAAAG